MNPESRPVPIKRSEEGRRGSLAREIALILSVKAVALTLIWWAWFSAPEASSMQVPPQRVQVRLLGTPAGQAPAASPTSPSGNPAHASH